MLGRDRQGTALVWRLCSAAWLVGYNSPVSKKWNPHIWGSWVHTHSNINLEPMDLEASKHCWVHFIKSFDKMPPKTDDGFVGLILIRMLRCPTQEIWRGPFFMKPSPVPNRLGQAGIIWIPILPDHPCVPNRLKRRQNPFA